MSTARFIGVAAVLALAGVSIAANTKIKSFHPAGAGITANSGVDGMAIVKLRTDPNLGAASDVHLHMQDLQAHQTYGVAIYVTGSVQADYVNVLAFSTNPSGNGSFDAFLPTLDLGPSPKIQVFLWDTNPDPESFLDITNCELRAEGCVN